MFGLSLTTIEKIHSIFRKYNDIEKVIIYGSRAKGSHKFFSDIDLTFEGETLSLNIMHHIAIELDDLLLPYEFDLSIKHQITNPDVLEHIDRIGKIFYQKKS